MIQCSDLGNGEKLFQRVVEQICRWNKSLPSVGAVIGATQNEFEKCIEAIQVEEAEVPLLVPGVGAQGGSYKRINEILEKKHYRKAIVRINASSSISYAHERFGSGSVEEAALHACEEILRS